jgi:hypothetical protein
MGVRLAPPPYDQTWGGKSFVDPKLERKGLSGGGKSLQVH